jgi:hypothetical protein
VHCKIRVELSAWSSQSQSIRALYPQTVLTYLPPAVLLLLLPFQVVFYLF